MPLGKMIVLPVLLLPLAGCGTVGRQHAESSASPPPQARLRYAEIQAHCMATTQVTLLQTEKLASCFRFARQCPDCRTLQ
jgi:hypothetical protein